MLLIYIFFSLYLILSIHFLLSLNSINLLNKITATMNDNNFFVFPGRSVTPVKGSTESLNDLNHLSRRKSCSNLGTSDEEKLQGNLSSRSASADCGRATSSDTSPNSLSQSTTLKKYGSLSRIKNFLKNRTKSGDTKDKVESKIQKTEICTGNVNIMLDLSDDQLCTLREPEKPTETKEPKATNTMKKFKLGKRSGRRYEVTAPAEQETTKNIPAINISSPDNSNKASRDQDKQPLQADSVSIGEKAQFDVIEKRFKESLIAEGIGNVVLSKPVAPAEKKLRKKLSRSEILASLSSPVASRDRDIFFNIGKQRCRDL